MATRQLHQLAAQQIATLGDGFHADGGSLYLKVRDGGKRRSWIFRYVRDGKATEMGLGRAGPHGVSLKDARAKRADLAKTLDDGEDPLLARRRKVAAEAGRRTFAEVADMVLAANVGGWKGGKASTSYGHWTRTLIARAKPLAKRPVDEITVDEIKRIVSPLWEKGHHGEARLSLMRMGQVFGYAIAHGWRPGDIPNPASWEQVFKHIAPKTRPNGKHHPAVEWKDTPAVVARLRAAKTMSGALLEFLALTATRLTEARGARFDELDLAADPPVWKIPEARMKRSLPHAVPLSERAIKIVRDLMKHRGRGALVFPSPQTGQPMHRASLHEACVKMTEGKGSPHGFRASFRSWCSANKVPFHVAEACLAHAKSAIVEAYDRETLIPERARVMERWSRFLAGEQGSAKVVPLRKGQR
jgi:integrase